MIHVLLLSTLASAPLAASALATPALCTERLDPAAWILPECQEPPPPAPTAASKLRPAFSFYVENDSIRVIGGADDSYTQGLALHVTRDRPWGFLRRPMQWLKPAGVVSNEDEASSLALGQSIFTPHNIITYTPAEGDRPFAGFLWVGAESSWVRMESRGDPEDPSVKAYRPKRLTLQASVGVIGPIAMGHSFQSDFHVLRESRIPKGWFSQLGNSPQANIMVRMEDRLLQLRRQKCDSGTCRDLTWFDFTTILRPFLGTTQTYLAAGGTLRLSPNHLTAFPAITIGASAAERTTGQAFEFAMIGGFEGRAMAYNAFLRDSPDISPRTLLYEWRYGIELRYREWRLSYTHIDRSQEFETFQPEIPDRHGFAAIQIVRTAPIANPSFDWKPLKGLRANLRFGKGRSSVSPGLPADPGLSLAGSWGLEKTIWKPLVVAWEKTGVSREQGPPGSTVCDLTTPPCHQDTFVLANIFSVGADLHLAGGSLAIQPRAGIGQGKLKVEQVPDTGDVIEPSKDLFGVRTSRGLSWLAGLRASYSLSKSVSAVGDAAYASMELDESGNQRASYWTGTLGLQIHPWGRDH